MSKFEEFSSRARMIQWNSESDAKRSQVRLFQEYLRRASLWATKFRETGWPFYDIAETIQPDFRAPEMEVREVLESIPEGGTFYTAKTIEWSLHFAALLDQENSLPGLPNPFDPLILIYERGSSVNLSSAGFIEVGQYSMPRKSPDWCKNMKPLSDLSKKSLDEFDKNNH